MCEASWEGCACLLHMHRFACDCCTSKVYGLFSGECFCSFCLKCAIPHPVKGQGMQWLLHKSELGHLVAEDLSMLMAATRINDNRVTYVVGDSLGRPDFRFRGGGGRQSPPAGPPPPKKGLN